LHVIDVSDPHFIDRRRQVELVLESIGAADIPCIQVYNKIDKARNMANVSLNGVKNPQFWVSAATNEGLIELTEEIRNQCLGRPIARCLKLGPDQSRLRARFFDLKAVRRERVQESGGWIMDVELTGSRWNELRKQEGVLDNIFQ